MFTREKYTALSTGSAMQWFSGLFLCQIVRTEVILPVHVRVFRLSGGVKTFKYQARLSTYYILRWPFPRLIGSLVVTLGT